MPVIRYFVFVGGALLAVLLALDLFAPPQPVAAGQAASIDKTVVRIRSDQKLPERVVYDTSLPTIVPPVVTAAVAPPVPPAAAAAEAQDRVRETFAQYAPESKKPEVQAQVPQKRKVARARPAHPTQTAQPSQVRVAQQSQFGFFGAPSPRSTWTW